MLNFADMKITLAAASSLVLMGSGFLDWLSRHLLSCPFKQFFHVDCPGCGLQRSIIALLRGDIATSFQLYPPTIPIIGLFVFSMIHLKFDLKNGAFFIKLLYIFISIVIVINYIYKIINHQLI